MTTALIDGDEFIYKACVIKHEGEVDWDTGDAGEKQPPTLDQALEVLERSIDAARDAAKCVEAIVCLSPDDRRLFRHGLFDGYKGGRSDKPEHFWKLVEFCRDTYPTEAIPGLEADDVMGHLQADGRVIVSSDKDMLTVPGRVYNPRTGKHSLIAPHRADRQWMLQTLTGDTTDGYGGCPGIGPIKAEAILDEAGPSLVAMWGATVHTFEDAERKVYAKHAKAGTTPPPVASPRVMASLARICRPGDYTPGTGAIRYIAGAHLFHHHVPSLIGAS